MADVVLVDDYDRATLGSAPNGQPYGGAGTWELVTSPDVGVAPVTGTGTLVYDTGHPDATVTVAFTAGTTGYPNGDGLALRWVDYLHYVSLTVGGGAVGLAVHHPDYHNTGPGYFEGGHTIGEWSVTLAAGQTWTVTMDGADYEVRQNGVLVGTATDPDARYLDAGNHGLQQTHVDVGSRATMTVLTVEFDHATRIRVNPGDPQLARRGDPAHLAVANNVEPWLGWQDDNGTLATNAPNGDPYQGSSNWSVVSGVLTPTVGGEHYRIVDTGGTDFDISTRIIGQGENTGLVVRWTNAGTFVGVSVNDQPGPDLPTVYIFTRNAYSYALPAHWADVHPAVPYDLRVTLTGDEVRIYIDGVDIGPPSTGTRTITHNAGETRGGLWATPYGTFDYLRWVPAGLDVDLDMVAAGAQLAAHAGVPYVAAPINVEPAHLAAHSGFTSLPGESTDVTIDVAPAIRGPVVYGPFITRPGQVIPRIEATIYQRGDLAHPLAVLDQSFDRHWQEILSEAGTGGLTLGNEDPDVAHVGLDTFVRFEDDGWAAFCMLVREIETQWIAQGEEVDQVTTLSGPGHIAILEEAVVWPSRGVGVRPIQQNRGFNWTSTDYDDQWWIYADELAQQGGDAGYWTGLPPVWPDPGAWWIWAHIPNSLEWAPAGNCYLRRVFEAPAGTAELEYYIVFDGEGELFIDGEPIAAGEYGIEPDINVYSGTVEVSPGPHTLAVRCANDIDPEADEVHNPGGVLFSAYAVNAAQQRIVGDPIVHSDGTWRIVEYPPSPPGMTPGEVLRHVIEEAQARGGLPSVELAFTDETDSDGVPWPETTDIATKVGYDLWTFFKELCATYIDLWMEPASFRLWAWNKGGRQTARDPNFRSPTDPLDPMSGNLVNLTYRTVQ